MSDNNGILVLAAHPDDEVLGCGGTMALLRREGRPVTVAILGEGITSRYDAREEADPGQIKALHGRSRDAAAILGVERVKFFNLPDNRFDQVALLDVVKIVEGLIEEVKPAVVLTQHGGDLNIDHQVVYRAALTATRPLTGHPVRKVLAYEVGSSTEWAFQRFSPPFHPSVFVDIGDTLELKIRAMETYESEARPFPHPRSPEALRAQAQRWGSAAGLRAAEAFELVRSVERGVTDL